ncbi:MULTISPECIES: Asp-tRNA(Asn)/Glu-tRNA(Gln) amidotransferase subunit GatB [Flectobacillus]|uniref:Asp-tRNA(Asn)/Glu-tRNA(Gln) amidotransferase subunit GatB n=1 Tax=Flectobacillus TaxID=101 RepID=UPI000BA49B35|nr:MULTISPECIES: Asp-tRNA(Asn)/Glu-tRNA(Gln) amidotransferase subunit GatB [Flectobacillus]MDI9871809.1 Asp-tRNA(Asn)/Glu-tRNA(Gln) amidotransferase subunit GatB [Flectobacillus roseus]PAC28097.1 Asp-tRNA(Asn)/Glu-tRNA(Gln) amidotransferase GatCAB subunit B [Flectobacillus sp. BAB-3569]
MNQEIRNKYEVVIGLEVHAQLQTESKIFAADSASFGAAPNTHISPITLGHPGTLPKLNRKAVEYAIKMGFATGSKISEYQYFDRKNYFYPDLPKGYQITQDKTPICIGGGVKVKLSTGEKVVRFHHIHLEEDAGKSLHAEGSSDSLIDYNRAGTPLIEMVTEPEIKSSEEAAQFMTEVRKLVRYLHICDGNMEEGSLRCDVNISVMPVGSKVFGTKVEIKNMNSIRFIQKAIDYEVVRQIEAVEAGEKIIQETRNFDPATGRTSGMREKESMNDYRYFPEPDLVPLHISEELLNQVKAQMPALPWELFEKFTKTYGLPDYDAGVLTDSREVAEYFDATCQFTKNYKAASNWIMGTVKSYLNDNHLEIEQLTITPEKLAQLINLVDEGKVSTSTASQQIFPVMVTDTSASPLQIAEAKNLIQQSNTDTLQSLIDEVLAANPAKVKEYKNGKKGLLGMFMGDIMKKSKGSADPKVTTALLQKTLDSL